MKTLSQETAARLTTICAGFAGSQAEISLRVQDLEELRSVTSGATLKSLEDLPDDAPSVKIGVPLLTKALQEAVPGLLGPVVEPAPASTKKPTGGKK